MPHCEGGWRSALAAARVLLHSVNQLRLNQAAIRFTVGCQSECSLLEPTGRILILDHLVPAFQTQSALCKGEGVVPFSPAWRGMHDQWHPVPLISQQIVFAPLRLAMRHRGRRRTHLMLEAD